jgi:hypothetical protein
MFTLPAGYRPAYQTLLASMTYSNVIGRIEISTPGVATPNVCNNQWFVPNFLSFLAAQ